MSANTNTTPPSGASTTTGSTISSVTTDQGNVRPGIIRHPRSKKHSSKFKSIGSTVSTTDKSSFKGETESINAILRLSNEGESIGHDGFTYFQKKLEEYVLKEYDNAVDLMPLILDLEDPLEDFEDDHMPTTKYTPEELRDNPIKKKLVENAVNSYTDRLEKLTNNVVTLWAHVWGQCTPALQAELEADPEFSKNRTKYDSLWLLKTCKKLIASIDSRGNPYYNAYQVMMDFNKLYQRENETPQEWLKRFQSAVETMYLADCDHIFYSKNISNLGSESSSAILVEKKKMEAMFFLLRSDPKRFHSLQQTLYMDMVKGQDHYPKTPTAVYDIMLQFLQQPTEDNYPGVVVVPGQTKVSYAMVRLVSGAEVKVDKSVKTPGVNGKVVERPCFHCGKWGHIMSECPDLSAAERQASKDRSAARRAASLLHVRFCGAQKHSDLVHPNYIMLDSCSESSVIMNSSLVHDVRACTDDERLLLVTNGGSMSFDTIGTLNLFPLPVHVNVHSMANILSLRNVCNLPGVRVTMDTLHSKAIDVHLPSGVTYSFLEGTNGLYFYDTTKPNNHIKPTVSAYSAYSFLSTVDDNKSLFTSRQIKGAEAARQLQERIGWPSVKDFKRYLNTNSIINSPVTADDVERAEYIFGPALPLLQGKMTTKSSRFRAPPPVMPSPILDFHKVVELFVDFLYVNKMPFLHTKSSNINFLTIQHFGSRRANEIIQGLQTVIDLYSKRGFEVSTIHGDNEFNIGNLIAAVRPILMQIYARGEHVGRAERSIRTIKERCRCICHSIPFKRYTRLMTTSLLDHVVACLNSFPSNDGISDTLSPAAIVVGRSNIDANAPMIEFGAYAAVHNGTTNTMKGRVTPAIALNRANDKGGYYFMSLETGRKIHGFIWTVKPINQQVINRVHYLANREGQPKLVNNCPIFEWSPGIPIDDEDNDDVSEDDDVEVHEDDDDIDALQLIPEEDEHEVDDDIVIPNDGVPVAEVTDIDDDSIEGNDDEDGVRFDLHDNDNEVRDDDTPDQISQEDIESIVEEVENEAHDQPTIDDTPTTAPSDGPRRSSRTNAGQGVERLQMDFKGKKYWSFLMKQALIKNGMKGVKLRSAKAQSYLMKKTMKDNRDDDYMKIATKVLFIQQMSAKKGIEKFGERAIAALFKELKQLDEGPMPGKPVIEPIELDELTPEMKSTAMNAINLIAEKACGKIKGRSCADGSKQKRYLKDGESVASPTASLEAINATWIIDAYEGRDVVSSDVPGAYLHANVPDDKVITMKFRGKQIIDIMCEVNPEYKKYVFEENGQKVLYVRVVRAIYGCIYSALLWYDLFSNTLKDMGFEINPYDRCVANKMVNGKQCTIVWYVDDLKVSHMDHKVNMEVIDKLREHFGALEATTGDDNTFLGINYSIDRENKKVRMEARKQVQEAIDKFGKDNRREVQSPAAHGLFQVNEESDLLSEDDADTFHSVVAKLLWLEKRVRPDIEPTIAFLSTRVSAPTKEDWSKLTRLINYLQTTVNDERIMGASSLDTLYTWIDAAYAVHPTMRSHTGGCMSFGLGTVHARSSKQKLNTKSSTESEVVGLSEYIPYNLWLLNFLAAQGYVLKSNQVYQDNQSAIKMEKNGRNSCTGNSRHIHIRYFFVKDRVDKGEVNIGYCPTEQMLADFFTKPLNGALFQKFKKVLMGHATLSTLSSPIKERVENIIDNVTDDENVPPEDSTVDGAQPIKPDGTSSGNRQKSYLQALLTSKNCVSNALEQKQTIVT